MTTPTQKFGRWPARGARKAAPAAHDGPEAADEAPEPAGGDAPAASVEIDGDEAVITFRNPTDREVEFWRSTSGRSGTRTVEPGGELVATYKHGRATVTVRLGNDKGVILAEVTPPERVQED